MKKTLAVIGMVWMCMLCQAKNVTIVAEGCPTSEVFRDIVSQTGMNFVYPSELLSDMTVSLNVKEMPLRKALAMMFRNTDIRYSIKGKNIILTRKIKTKTAPSVKAPQTLRDPKDTFRTNPNILEEIVVVSRLEAPAIETAEIGAKKLTGSEIENTPVIFGESDIVKALQKQPGVSEGTEGMAGMHVHGGESDENLFMLDNVPLYQVNHFAGLFSAFNVDAIRYIDFFKSSIPAKYDGRLSSYVDVRTKNGSQAGHHGSFRLGLTSGAFNINGPIGGKTSYSVGLRRSWFDVLSVPLLAIANASSSSEKIRFRYAFMDLNGKVTHRFNDRASGFVSVYFGDDELQTGEKDADDGAFAWLEDEKFNLKWGNILAQTGFNYKLNTTLTGEFTAAYTRFFSSMKHDDHLVNTTLADTYTSRAKTRTENNINDAIFRGDFDWHPDNNNHARFGAGYTLHSFLPARTSREYSNDEITIATRDSTMAYLANEVNLYIEDEWKLDERFMVNAGLHASLFNISGKTHYGLGPRLSLSYRAWKNIAIKAAYARTNQYVHQLCQTYLSLPTDQWVPITGKFKPQTADKISAGVYWQSKDRTYAVSVEGYYKYMRNLLDYREEYYLQPPMEMWNARLCAGRGTAKGIDFKVEKVFGKFTGHISYSISRADRTFADKNGGKTFPARFDQPHAINILLNWNVNDRVQLNASWTGHSGNRFTLLTQVWDSQGFDMPGYTYYEDSPLKAAINNYRLPFYHRLDLSCTVNNKRGYWNFSLYNAYCHMNTVAIRRGYDNMGKPTFQKVKWLPLIPSISYTWQF